VACHRCRLHGPVGYQRPLAPPPPEDPPPKSPPDELPPDDDPVVPIVHPSDGSRRPVDPRSV
jgi:hypothetical protein